MLEIHGLTAWLDIREFAEGAVAGGFSNKGEPPFQVRENLCKHTWVPLMFPCHGSTPSTTCLPRGVHALDLILRMPFVYMLPLPFPFSFVIYFQAVPFSDRSSIKYFFLKPSTRRSVVSPLPPSLWGLVSSSPCTLSTVILPTAMPSRWFPHLTGTLTRNTWVQRSQMALGIQ